MSYITTVTLTILGKDHSANRKIAEAIQKEYDMEITQDDEAYGSLEGEFSVNNYALKRSFEPFFQKLSKKNPEATIQLECVGEDRDDEWMQRFKDGETEIIEMKQVWERFQTIMTDDEKKKADETKPGVLEKMQQALDLLSSIRGSGYWPYASPAPCSTEVRIKKNLDSAIVHLEDAMYFHKKMFTKVGRDPMKSASTVIVDPNK